MICPNLQLSAPSSQRPARGGRARARQPQGQGQPLVHQRRRHLVLEPNQLTAARVSATKLDFWSPPVSRKPRRYRSPRRLRARPGPTIRRRPPTASPARACPRPAGCRPPALAPQSATAWATPATAYPIYLWLRPTPTVRGLWPVGDRS